MHESQNWLQVEHDGWKLPATKDIVECALKEVRGGESH